MSQTILPSWLEADVRTGIAYIDYAAGQLGTADLTGASWFVDAELGWRHGRWSVSGFGSYLYLPDHGFPLARSTMNDLLHRTSELTQPLWQRLVEQIRARPIVGADETRLLMQNDGTGKPKNGFVWTFVAPDEHGEHDVAYLFAGNRSGDTPKRLLGGTKGTLIVDAYSGYNVVADVSRRKRAACHAHLRRYFHEALPTAPIAQHAIDLILGIYRVEHDAKEQKITGTKAHLRLRRQRAGPIREQLHAWLLEQKPRHPPKSPIAAAIRYALNQWRELGRFLDDARVPLDNNASERSLRRVATWGSLCVTPSSTWKPQRSLVRRIATRATAPCACA